MMAMILIHEFLAAVLLYSCFCRAVRMSKRTHQAIRLAFWAESIAAVIAFFAPFTGWQPDSVTMALLLGGTSVQLVTALFWIDGVPVHFQSKTDSGAPHAAQRP